MQTEAAEKISWTFLSNHAHVLLCIARDPEARMRDVAAVVGITERAVQRIVRDLIECGYLLRQRSGRRNRYAIDPARPLRHPLEAARQVESLLSLVLSEPELRRLLTASGDRLPIAPPHVAASTGRRNGEPSRRSEKPSRRSEKPGRT